MYIDNNDWSGVTYSLGEGKFIDLSKVRDKGGLYFWIKGKLGGEKLYVGILDNQGHDIKSQTKVGLNDWIKVSKDWQLAKIPLKRFTDKGKAWDANKSAEVAKDIKWTRFRKSASLSDWAKTQANGKPAPVTVFVDQITFTSNIDWVDPDLKWDSFKSNAPDYVISDFEGKFAKDKWEPSTGPKSQLKFKGENCAEFKSNCLNIEHYLLADWVDVVLDMQKNGRPAADRDWTKHWGLMFDVYSDKAWQSITVQVQDAGNEIFVSNVGAPKARPQYSFRSVRSASSRTINRLTLLKTVSSNLQGVTALDFRPSGEGTAGGFKIDNIRLTNQRAVKAKERPAVIKVLVKGEKEVLNPEISGGLFGINAAFGTATCSTTRTSRFRLVNSSNG
uniref:Cellulase n=1 Tax=Fibrobacter succinogenes TaxID=833 RepID=Q47929_FIBSU|nr:cellulase [Fibrobacter succinogenes]